MKRLLFVIMMTALLVSGLSFSYAEDPPQFILKWGSSGEFNRLMGIAVDLNNNVFVTDTNNDRVQKFTNDGQFITSWTNGLDYPLAVAVDQNGNVYVVEHYNWRLQKFTNDGQFITSWTNGLSYPLGVAVDANNVVYVSNTNYPLDYIRTFDTNGNFLNQWGSSHGSEDGQFYYPCGIAFNAGGDIFIADQVNGRVQKFNSGFQFLTKWSTDSCRGIAVDTQGNVYVTNEISRTLKKFDNNGTLLSTLGPSVTGSGSSFTSPFDVDIDTQGNIYVADQACVWKFYPTTTSIQSETWGHIKALFR